MLLPIICVNQNVFAQQKPALEYQVKAAYLFNFTKFVYWPETAFSDPTAPFVIGVVGKDPFGSYLDDVVKDEKVGAHPIVIERYGDAKEINSCHILYISRNNVDEKNVVDTYRSKKNMLSVSDEFSNWGGIINFYTEDNKVKLKIVLKAVRNAGLEISSKLLKIAKLQ